jgi:hypothetical protein
MFFSLSYLFTKYNRERGERENKKRPWSHIKAPITILSIPSEKPRRDKFNDTKKSHQR